MPEHSDDNQPSTDDHRTAAYRGLVSRHDAFQQWIREELVMLWSDLAEHRRSAHDGCWSMGCEDTGERIKEATALVGPVSWRNIGCEYLFSGDFAYCNGRIGIANPDLPSEEDMAEIERTYIATGGTYTVRSRS